MNVHIDIGHPAHVHYFKYLISCLKEDNHSFLITARDKEITFELLNYYGIKYYKRGKGGQNLLTKIFYIPYADYILYRLIKKYKCNLSLSFASTYAAHSAKLAGIPHIALDDTEHASLEIFLYSHFTDVILTPSCFTKNLGVKQLKYNAYTELLYLHKKYFVPDPNIKNLLNVNKDEDYAIVRFVSWSASHDFKENGLTYAEKILLVEELAKKMRVFISSEGKTPKQLDKYIIKIHPAKLHDALFFSRIYVGEGGTTASEAAILGTPAVYINNLTMGYINEEKKAGLLFQSTELRQILNTLNQVLQNPRQHYKSIAAQFISKKINVTSFLYWFIKNYPKSFKTMKKNPDYQYNFK